MRAVPRSGGPTLSPRQAEIAELLRSGKSSREIGALLCIDPRTVDVHVNAICNKLGVRTRVEIVVALARSKADAQPADHAPRRSNLPLQVTSFIGREREIAEITALLGRHRLVTLTGSGGVGKTRTSLQVAASASGSSDGVWFIELAPLSRGDYVPTTIAQAVGVTLDVNGDPVDQLVAALKSKNMLLVIDNCEHLIDASARIVSALINSCPRLTILASSRQGLGIVGEVAYRMPSLPVPATAAGDIRAQSASQFAAVALFVERATELNNRFELTDANAASVIDICRRLDGIALAIELAAAWVKILSPQQLRSRLDERFRLLTGGGRDRLPRHQTLRALIDWSHELLDEGEQRLFRRLGIFANGFTFEAASAVGRRDEVDGSEVFDQLASLVEKSLVMADPHGDAVRYRLLESTRVYAAEKLVEAGERDALASQHLRYFRDWFVELRREHDQLRPGIGAAFATELDDLRLALDGALALRELGDGAELLAAIGPGCWIGGGLAREGIARCEALLAELPTSEPRLRAELGISLTFILTNMARLAQAREAAVAALGYARTSEDGPITASALNNYANALLFSGDFLAAECALREAEAIQGTSPFLRLRLLDCRAILSTEMGDLDAAAHSFAQLREEWRSAAFRDNYTVATAQLGDIEFRRGQYQHAAELSREAVSLARCDTLSGYLPVFLVRLGSVLAVSGAIDEAVSPAVEAMMLGTRQEPRHDYVMPAIELLAYIAAVQGNFDRSARLAGYAEASVARIDYTRDYAQLVVYERLMTRLRERLAPSELARTKAEGAFLTRETAIAFARTLE